MKRFARQCLERAWARPRAIPAKVRSAAERARARLRAFVVRVQLRTENTTGSRWRVISLGPQRLLSRVILLGFDRWYARIYRRVLSDPGVPLLSPGEVNNALVLSVIGSLGPGGAERQLVNTLRGTFTRGYRDLAVVAQYLDDEVSGFFRSALSEFSIPTETLRRGPDIIDVGLQEHPDNARLRAFVTRHRRKLPDEIGDVWAYVRELVARKPAVFHGWLDEVNAKAGLAAAIVGVPRIVLSTRSVAPYHFGLFQPFMREAYRALARLPQVTILSNSDAGARDYERWLRLPAGTIKTIHNGFDFSVLSVDRDLERRRAYRERLGLPDDCLVVGTVIRFSEEKRPIFWLETARHVASRNRSVRFLMVGDGPQRDEVARLATEHGISDRVVLPGRETKPLDAIASMDLFLLTSRQEGFPNVLIEAQAMGVPVVSSDSGGARETFVDGRTGWLIARDTPEEAAALVERALADRGALSAAGAAGAHHVRSTFDAASMVTQTLEVYGLRPR